MNPYLKVVSTLVPTFRYACCVAFCASALRQKLQAQTRTNLLTELCGMGFMVRISHVKCLATGIVVMIALLANARTARDAYLQERNESLFRLAQDESDLVLPVFGRYVVLPDGRKTRVLRSIENRLNGYFHECILRQPIKTVSSQSVRRWKSNRIRFRSYDKLSGEKFYELQNQLEDDGLLPLWGSKSYARAIDMLF